MPGNPSTINIPPRTRSRAAGAAIVLVGLSPMKKIGMTPSATSKLPRSKLMPLSRYNVVDDIVKTSLQGTPACSLAKDQTQLSSLFSAQSIPEEESFCDGTVALTRLGLYLLSISLIQDNMSRSKGEF